MREPLPLKEHIQDVQQIYQYDKEFDPSFLYLPTLVLKEIICLIRFNKRFH